MLRWPDAVYDYILAHTRFDDPLLKEMEQRAKRDGFPIIGPLIGPWLYLLTRLVKARRVFELGAGFGYSTYYFAAALRDNGGGTVTHTVWDAASSKEARAYMERAGLLVYCDFQVSESVLALEVDPGGIDVMLMDIDKEFYVDALPVIQQKLRPGGLLLTDNVLWDGEVAKPEEGDEACETIKRFNRLLHESGDWEYVINPLRDGLGVAQLKGEIQAE